LIRNAVASLSAAALRVAPVAIFVESRLRRKLGEINRLGDYSNFSPQSGHLPIVCDCGFRATDEYVDPAVSLQQFYFTLGIYFTLRILP
jgi:hypothetical protein